nr:glutaminyl-peptide cyclotransferase [uncultured Carboxylicivirga sp.]
MKRFRKLIPVIVVVTLAGCSVLLKTRSIKNNSDRIVFTNNDTLIFKTFSKKNKIDSVVLNDDVFIVGKYTFQFPLSDLNGGIHQFDWSFNLSNGKVKRISKEFLIVADSAPKTIVIDDYKKVKHNTSLFTQGLEFYNDVLYESAGKYGESTINIINHQTGDIIKRQKLKNNLFAEGLTFVNHTINLLTWKEGSIIKFDSDLNLLTQADYHREGWGLCSDGENLIASDGSEHLYLINPATLNVIRELVVFNHEGTIDQLNELEWINGYVMANVWGKDYIVIIDPVTGVVVYKIDFANIIQKYNLQSEGTLNGIAYNKLQQEIYLTGKNWSYYFIISLPKELQLRNK